MFQDHQGVEMAIRLPNLREFQSLDVNVMKLHLTPALTPKVETIWMQNPTTLQNPDYRIVCPQLQHFSFYYWGPGKYQWLRTMLDRAPKLVSFDSFKLHVPSLQLVHSKHLKTVRLHRNEALQRLDVRAPRLTTLNLQAVYQLRELHFLGPDDSTSKPKLEVNVKNAAICKQVQRSLNAHPRIHETFAEQWEL